MSTTSQKPPYPVEPTLCSYQRDDGSWVCHVDTVDMEENSQGPLLTVYINDGYDPIYDNRKEIP